MDFDDVRTVGIPRGLLWWRYGVLWQTFLEQLGFRVIVSDATDRAVLEAGAAVSVDECCLASKVYLGHAAQLIGRCDALFVPCYGSADHRAGFCTKYQSLPDLVRNTFRDRAVVVLSLRVEQAADKKKTRAAFLELAHRLGASPAKAAKAWKAAVRAQEKADRRRADEQAETRRLMREFRRVVARDTAGVVEPPLSILVVAHPYIAHDPYIAGDIVDAIERLGATVLFADEADHASAFKRSFRFSETLPWLINRELAGALMELEDEVDGIVLVSAFPCGPDSMFDDAVMRAVTDTPVLNLMIDAQSGSAGMETRVESFVDILRYRRKGAYIHG